MIQAQSSAHESRSTPRVRSVALVVFRNVHFADIVAPQSVFESASRLLQQQGVLAEYAYPLTMLGATAGPIPSSQGITFKADRSYLDFDETVDTLLVAGGEGSSVAREDAGLLDWLRSMAPRARRYGSICTGAFILANAGLLDGKRATTHVSVRKLLAEKYSRIQVEPEASFVRDGSTYSSSGAAAGTTMALGLVEEDWGRRLGEETAAASWLCRSDVCVSA
jgi:transcriptional regulator GlxA family with amidase domain